MKNPKIILSIFVLFTIITNVQQATAQTTLNTTIEPGPSSDATYSTCPTLYRNLWVGLRGSDVSSLQTFLHTTGDFTYFDTTIFYGKLTASAVERFQCRELGICSGSAKVNGFGVLGPKTRASVARACSGKVVTPEPVVPQSSTGLILSSDLWMGLRSNNVSQLQTFLRSTGDFTYPEITGYYGNITVQAVQRYQCRTLNICNGSQNINGYGVVGPKTRASFRIAPARVTDPVVEVDPNLIVNPEPSGPIIVDSVIPVADPVTPIVDIIEHDWATGPWGECSVGVGSTGHNTRHVSCVGSDQLTYSDNLCASSTKPSSTQSCTVIIDTMEVAVPDAGSVVTECHPQAARANIGMCINKMLTKYHDVDTLTIRVAPGIYAFDHGVVLFEDDNRTIVGSGRNQTIFKLKEDFNELAHGGIDNFFFFNIVDSNNITIDAIHIDASNTAAQRGIAVCPTGANEISNIKIKNTYVENLVGFYTLVGNAYGTHLKNNFISEGSDGARRLKNKLGGKDTLCSGYISKVEFSGNTLDLHSVGFYVVPYSTAQTTSQTVTLANWRDVAKKASSKNTNYRVLNNQFNAVGDTRLLHSFSKIHFIDDVLYEGNTFTIPNHFTQAAIMGGAINMISNSNSEEGIMIKNNRFIYPAEGYAYRYSVQAVNIKSSFSSGHTAYSFGDNLIGVPSFGIRVESNDFINSSAHVFNCCPIGLKEWCENADSTQSTPEMTFKSNTINGAVTDQQDIVSFRSEIAPAAWLEGASCRTNIKINYEE